MTNNNETTQWLNASLFKALNQQDAKLLLIYQGKTRVFKPGVSVFTIGRNPACNIVIDNLSCSRLHLNIVYRKGKFVLEVKGLNGVFVRTDTGHEICVAQQEQIPLTGLGIIGLGKPTGQCGNNVVHFKCEYTENEHMVSIDNTGTDPL